MNIHMERWIKANIDDGMLGTILSRGIFTTFGLDLSTKLNQSKIEKRLKRNQVFDY